MTTSPLFYQAGPAMPEVSHGQGVFLWDTRGKEYLDGCSGAISCNLGHGHPDIRAAMLEQLDRVAFTYRTQFENGPAIELGETLVEMTNSELEKVFFVSSGSEAMESAQKLARQYFVAIGKPQRRHFVSLRPSYHGSTLGALGLTGYQPLEAPFADIITGSIKVPSPDFYRQQDGSREAHIARLLSETRARFEAAGGDSIIAVVVEPVGGASTGARLVDRGYLQGLRDLCDEIGCLLIYDEVLCGVGRTGSWFAYQQWGVAPDILATAKGLGAGYYPVGAILSRAPIVEAVMTSDGFQHGHTYAGNPLACATALAAIRAIQRENLLENVAARGAQLQQGLHALQARFDWIGDVRGLGLLWGVELVSDADSKTAFPADANLFAKATALAKEEGLLIYPRRTLDGVAGDHFLVSPPFIINEGEVEQLLERLERALSRLDDDVIAPLRDDSHTPGITG
ncbi:aspartate aminotransferase family protein [Halomonas halodenitrificans]|uniref:aminotransferase family protein n=1 Tax=Halomonas halodenitrificans TaxID=28252 RepID=UPI0006869464|nr:aspartate aminotransferase family protein [Halomonas halodenitrificans]